MGGWTGLELPDDELQRRRPWEPQPAGLDRYEPPTEVAPVTPPGAAPLGGEANPPLAPPEPVRMPSASISPVASSPVAAPVASNQGIAPTQAQAAPVQPPRSPGLVRGLGTLGQVAGSLFIPRAMPFIPGTEQNKAAQSESAQTEASGKAENELKTANAEKARADARKAGQPPAAAKPSSPSSAAYETLSDPNATPAQKQQALDSLKQITQAEAKPDKTPEQEKPLGERVPQLNQSMNSRYNILHPGASLPPYFTLGADATQKDYDRVDKALEANERAYGTKAQQDTTNEMRRQTMEISQQGLDLRKSMAGQGSGTGNPNLQGKAYLDSMPPSERNIVQAIGEGRIAPDRMGYLLARNQKLLNDVMQAYPDTFDSSKVQSYPQVYKNFTSGKISVALNSGSTALRHLAQLKEINDKNPTEVRIPGTASNKAYNNLLDTVADELGTFYGEPKTNEVIQSKKATLGGLLNRDSAIREQAIAMGVKFDEFENTWKNAAPSSVYQAPMPAYSESAKKARALLDPTYQPTGGGGENTPAGATHEVVVGGKVVGYVVNGKYVKSGK